jgi:hypothetical protein
VPLILSWIGRAAGNRAQPVSPARTKERKIDTVCHEKRRQYIEELIVKEECHKKN